MQAENPGLYAVYMHDFAVMYKQCEIERSIRRSLDNSVLLYVAGRLLILIKKIIILVSVKNKSCKRENVENVFLKENCIVYY
jgi:hypothetical protein